MNFGILPENLCFLKKEQCKMGHEMKLIDYDPYNSKNPYITTCSVCFIKIMPGEKFRHCEDCW